MITNRYGAASFITVQRARLQYTAGFDHRLRPYGAIFDTQIGGMRPRLAVPGVEEGRVTGPRWGYCI